MQKKPQAPGSMPATYEHQPAIENENPAPAVRPLDGRTFRVGAVDYTVAVAPGPLSIEGAAISGGTMEAEREILIAGDVTDGVQRVRVMLRELARAWTFEVGEPATAADWINLAGTVALAALRELLPAAEWTKLADAREE
jgi:hypothetical protein